jgi:hypothetical protein
MKRSLKERVYERVKELKQDQEALQTELNAVWANVIELKPEYDRLEQERLGNLTEQRTFLSINVVTY